MTSISTGTGPSQSNQQSPADRWATESPTAYSLDKFYTSVGKDSGVMSLRVSSGTVYRMESLIAAKKYTAYRTQSDIVRDAIHHLLQRREGEDSPDMDQALRQARLIQALADDELRNLEHGQANKKAGDIIMRWLSEGYQERAQKFFNVYMADVQGMKDPFWVNYHIDKLKQRLGDLWGMFEQGNRGEEV